MLRRSLFLVCAIAIVLLIETEASQDVQQKQANDSPKVTTMEATPHRRMTAQFFTALLQSIRKITIIDVAKFVALMAICTIIGDGIARAVLGGVKAVDKKYNPKEPLAGLNYTDSSKVLPLGNLTFIQEKVDELFVGVDPLDISQLHPEDKKYFDAIVSDLKLVGISITMDRVLFLDRLANLPVGPAKDEKAQADENVETTENAKEGGEEKPIPE